MSAYTTRWCKEHGDWDDDVDNPAEACPMCIESGAFKTRAQLERDLAAANAENAKLRKHAEAMEAAIFDLSAYDSNDAVIAYRAWRAKQ